MKKNIAVFASGNGTNAQALIEYFKDHPVIQVCLIITDNPKAKVIERAVNAGIPMLVIGKLIYNEGIALNNLLKIFDIDFVILAGYLKAIPPETIALYPNKIINIHPSLLPNYGGKGMYGDRVHESVLRNSEKQSGITIHFVTENYDEGPVIFQESISISPDWTIQDLKLAIHELEHLHFSRVVEEVIVNRKSIEGNRNR